MEGLDIFFVIWFPLLWAVVVFGSVSFYRNHRIQPIKVRMPRLVLCSIGCLLVWCTLIPLQRLDFYSGGVLALHFILLLGPGVNCLLVRMWVLLFAFGIGHERASAATGTGWFLIHRHWATERARVLVFFIPLAVQAALFIILGGLSSWDDPARHGDNREYVDFVGLALVALYSTCFLVGGCKFRRWACEGYYLAQEHITLGVMGWLAALVHLALVLTGEWGLAELLAVLFCSSSIFTLCFYPLIKKWTVVGFQPFSFHRAFSPKAFDDLNMDSPPDTLLAFMARPDGKKVFSDFLASEFSLENLQFLDAIERFKSDFKGSTDVRAVYQAAKGVYEEFLSAGSPSQVSVASATLTRTVKELQVAAERAEAGDQTVLAELLVLFDAPGKLVFTSLSSDAFPRFLQSKTFTTLQEEKEAAPLIFGPGLRPWTSWINTDTRESREERERVLREARDRHHSQTVSSSSSSRSS